MDREDFLYVGAGTASMFLGYFSIKASWKNWKREKEEVAGLYDRLEDKLNKILYTPEPVTKDQVSALASDLSYAANNSDVRDVVSNDIIRLDIIAYTFVEGNTKQQEVVNNIAESTKRNFSEIKEEAISDVNWEYVGKAGVGVGLGIMGACMVGYTIRSYAKNSQKTN